MMFRILIVASALLGAAPALAQQSISYSGTGNGWTGGRISWSISPSGRGRYESTQGKERISRQFNAGRAGFARIDKLLGPLLRVRKMPCRIVMTDQGAGKLSWQLPGRSRSLDIDLGCARNGEGGVWQRFNAAHGLITQWGRAR